MRTIAITGMGIVSPIGIGVDCFRDGLFRGADGIGPLTRFDPAGYPFRRAGQIDGLRLPGTISGALDGCDPATQFMAVAGLEALREAGLTVAGGCPDETGIVLSSNFGGIIRGERLLEQVHGSGHAVARDFAEYGFQACADRLADLWSLCGPRMVLSLSCASGGAALGTGVELVRRGRAAAVLTGGTDALSRFAWSGLGALRTMTRDRIRPFDAGRDGTIFSEGAAALVVEDTQHARARGARIQAYVRGYALNNNAHHMTAPARDGAGSAAVMRAALADSGLAPEQVDHINAHGTGTRQNDATETAAIKAVFGAHADRLTLTSIKSMTGHLMGAAGSAEALASVLTMREGLIPPTINYRDPDPECDLDLVANEPRRATVRRVLSNSAGIGGCNAAVILEKAD